MEYLSEAKKRLYAQRNQRKLEARAKADSSLPYKIISGSSKIDLERQISDYLKDGFELVGGVAFALNGVNLRYYQGVYKAKGDKLNG